MYFYEIHCHTKETSPCSCCGAKEMVENYKRLGFTGMVITDHFLVSSTDDPKVWNENIDAFLQGYKTAKATGDAVGIRVYLGLEFNVRAGTGEDYLTLGLTEEQIRNHLMGCTQWGIEKYIDVIHQLGGIVIRAHPCRKSQYITIPAPDRSGLNVDAIEVFNGGNSSDLQNRDALSLALREGKPMVAGSDTHHILSNAIDYLGFENDPEDYAALCQAIREGKAYMVHRPKKS